MADGIAGAGDAGGDVARRTAAVRWRELRQADRERAEALDRVRGERARLVPGVYVPAGPSVWRRLGTALPGHLRRTKAHDARGPARRVLDGLRAVTRPGVLLVRRTASGEHRYPIAVATFEGGVVLLDPSGGVVARVRTGPDHEADALRRRLAAHVATAAFEPAEDGRVVVEEFVAGDAVLDLPADDLEDVVRRLCEGWTRLSAAEAEGTWDELLDTAVEACRGLDVPGPVRRVVEAGVPPEVRGWPLVPAATDARLRNVVRRDGVPVLIDLADVRLEPWFAYPLGTVLDGGATLFGRYLAGGLDDVLGGLATAAGAAWPPAPWSRLDVLAVRTLVVTAQADGTEPSVLAEGVRRRWRPVERLLRASRTP